MVGRIFTRRWGWLVALTLCSVAGASGFRALLSPGPVGEGHIPNEGNCDSCHLQFKGIPDVKCLDCHEEIAGLIATKGTFHGKVRDQRCVECHTDHKGRGHDQIRQAALDAFDHADSRFPLDFAHAQQKCEGCHEPRIDELGTSCSGCHEDTHEGALGKTCESCHKTEGFKVGLKTLDAHRVSMLGGHEGLECKTCHETGEHLSKDTACADCHDRDHGGTTAACDQCHKVDGFKPAEFSHKGCSCQFPGKHQSLDCLSCHKDFKFTDTPTTCSGCHAKEQKHEPLGQCSRCHSALSWTKNLFDHNRQSKFKIDGAHENVACVGCHPRASEDRRKKVFTGAPSACQGCHAESGMAAHGDFGACSTCHTTGGFDRPTFDHATTGFPLVGRHLKLKCQDCHAQKVPRKARKAPKKRRVRRKKGGRATLVLPEALKVPVRDPAVFALLLTGSGPSPMTCEDCHEDPHRQTAPGTCESCHSPEAWAPAAFGIEEHTTTAFPLKGKHREVACGSCHVDLELSGQPTACVGCHMDRHGGKLQDECQDCHSELGWKPVTDFEHARHTGFALVGRHASLACESCHGQDTSLSEGKVETCAGCHMPRHSDELGLDCASCHKAEDKSFAQGFDRVEFKHERTAFPLTRRHQAVRCGACHIRGKEAPPTDRCAGCHIDPHSAQLGSECQDCHRPDRWNLVRFDHAQTSFALRGAHFVAPCGSCHTNQRWVGLTTECWDCHAIDAARGLAKDRAAGRNPPFHPFGRLDCRDCHFNSWRFP